eukprot:CAMPEP_0178881094 /NCGR_PEP_ID=MMETSP0747-20121128/12820_1 /TAXON_ID=913974 /ORGANISM="Nitzschia punctata, Strain CCMP561" /LENGTH=1373 /DNA_ID=CAMNT_0020549045 /DNA_START=176 /DNA_END=4298 /DNA_ORIENTATION=+
MASIHRYRQYESSSTNKNNVVVETWQPPSRRQTTTTTTTTTLPELLRLRQTYGSTKSHIHPPVTTVLRQNNHSDSHYKVASSYLAYRGAWNPRRLQNTVLAVGPGTPASVVVVSGTHHHHHRQRRPSQRPSHLAEEDDDDEEEPSSSSSSSQESSSSSSSESSSTARHEEEGRGHATTSTGNVQHVAEEERKQDDDDEDANAMEEDDDDDDDDNSSRNSRRRRRRRRQSGLQNREEESMELYEFLGVHDDSDEDDSEDDDDDDDDSEEEDRILLGRFGRRAEDALVVSSSSSSSSQYCPSMRHGGCINTAAWLDCGWRLSTTTRTSEEGGGSSSSNENNSHVYGIWSEECPTQLVTSGDDHLVKFWDVRSAMGMTSPLPGGRSTICPFSASKSRNPHDLEEEWQSLYDARQGHKKCHNNNNNSNIDDDYHLPGSVRLLATLRTGHRGNVFHVTPLEGKPGVVATCGADGFLRVTNMELGESSIVVSPEYDDELSGLLPMGLFSLRRIMCFSHHFMNQNVGLLCSERGLRRFDLRLSPREQSTQNLLGSSFRGCKACAILSGESSSLSSSTSSSSLTGGETSYVFAGGSSPSVALCDLRMTDHSQSRVVQYYTPSGLSPTDHVSVSGLDLSRDRQELLVSYESDQIYTFPIFPKSRSPAISTMGQVEELLRDSDDQDNDESRGVDSSSVSAPSDGGGRRVNSLPELACYGAHLNRLTFLKNARYAGPRDEYICTGSDSGHAWVYEKATGAVVSFWKADNSTCNGVIPHPTLPFFITYGIDSTAKLWRSTIPVDPNVDDSAVGRRKHYRAQKYEMSPTIRNWAQVESVLDNLDLRDGGMEQTEIFADHIPSTKILMRRGRLARSWGRDSPSNIRGVPKIGNDLHNLQQTLKENLYTCLRSLYDDDDVPVESDIDDLKHRISLIRLRHQADRLGLTWNPSLPWAMDSQKTAATENEKLKDSPEDHNVDPSDLVPDYPSDWMPYDSRMSCEPFDFRDYFNRRTYEEYYRDHYSPLDERDTLGTEKIAVEADCDCAHTNECDDTMNLKDEKQADGDRDMDTDEEPGDEEHKAADETKQNDEQMLCDERDSDDGSLEEQVSKRSAAKTILLETMTTLKEGGNAALKAGNLNLAAHRYDKAIQYGAMLYMKNRAAADSEWNPLLKTLIVTRLNLALVLLKTQFCELQVAANQANLALRDLAPFCAADKGGISMMSPENREEILNLRSKAYFRLGSAQYEMGDFSSAIKSFEESIKSKNDLDANAKPDQLLVRRLAEAKRELSNGINDSKKKFKMAFASAASPLAASPSSPASSSSSSAASSVAAASSTAAVMSPSDAVRLGTAETASTTSTAVVSNTKASPPGNSGPTSHDSETNPLNAA